MRLKSAQLANFGSYPTFQFDFSNVGLALIYGPTGSGKSTIQDAACWCLYGRTAKEGNADEVRSWQADGAPTKGTLEVELPAGTITVTRVRGKPGENDLYWTESGTPDEQRRGKDLTETQRLLENRLGVSFELYSTGAYFHEFSATAGFFTAAAKTRRALFERIAPLELPARLADRSSAARKEAKASLSAAETQRAKLTGRLEQLRESHSDALRASERWDAQRADTLRELTVRSENFVAENMTRVAALQTKADRHDASVKERTEALLEKLQKYTDASTPDVVLAESVATIKGAIEAAKATRCPSCGGPTQSDNLEKLWASLTKAQKVRSANKEILAKLDATILAIEALEQEENPYASQVQQARDAENHYTAQIDAELKKVNPFEAEIGKLNLSIGDTSGKLKVSEEQCNSLELRVSRLTRLYDLSAVLRGELLRKAVKEMEDSTNHYLDTYFDAELRVTFSLDGDDLEVGIQKSGYDCVYRQLSKGQRGLLRLAFTVSIMKAASNAAGVHFGQLFFDEALDGLDVDLKVRAYGLFQELEGEHESILVIDHSSELKEMFGRRFQVTIAGDASTMLEEQS